MPKFRFKVCPKIKVISGQVFTTFNKLMMQALKFGGDLSSSRYTDLRGQDKTNLSVLCPFRKSMSHQDIPSVYFTCVVFKTQEYSNIFS